LRAARGLIESIILMERRESSCFSGREMIIARNDGVMDDRWRKLRKNDRRIGGIIAPHVPSRCAMIKIGEDRRSASVSLPPQSRQAVCWFFSREITRNRATGCPFPSRVIFENSRKSVVTSFETPGGLIT